MTSTDSGRIVVRRKPGGYRDRLRSYKVRVDGADRGPLPAGGTVEAVVRPGRHEGARSVADLLDRRTRIGLVPADRERAVAVAERVLAEES